MVVLPNNVLLILSGIALIFCIVLGSKTRWNVGIWALVFTWIIYTLLGGVKVSTLIGYFPAKNVYVFIAPALFFGYANQNGTLERLADKLVYATRKTPWLYPFIPFVLSFLLAALGCSSAPTALITGTICFALAEKAEFNPMLVSLGTGCGLTACCIMPSNVTFAAKRTYLAPYFEEERLFDLALNSGIFVLIVCIVTFLLLYFFCKGYKAKKLDDFEKPQPLSSLQKKNAIVILVVMLLVLVPVILKMIFPASETIKTIASYLDIQVLALAGSVVCMVLKLGDDRQVISRLPWGIFLMAGGFYTLLQACNAAGLGDVLVAMIPAGISVKVAMAIILIMGGVLSMFTGAYTVWLMLLPIAFAIYEANPGSVNMNMVAIAATCGAMLSSVSPFSTSGAGVMAATPEKFRDKLYFPQLYLAIAMTLVGAVLCLTPLGGSMFSF